MHSLLERGKDTLLLSTARKGLEDICFVILYRGDCRHKLEQKGPSRGAAVITHLAGTVMACLAVPGHRWEGQGEGLLAQQSSSMGGKGGRVLWEDSGLNLPLGSWPSRRSW